ncbi:MAG: Gfo/Idh/MocA family oxidoreductase [Lentisphaerae bacterium]|nr:Gfo/Idh/MocA family oxidoreductase [Lentisphaerota bacterium]
MNPMTIGVIGCGNISPAYFKTFGRFPVLRVKAVADRLEERARARAQEYGIPHVFSVEALLADPEIELVVNLTTPQGHVPLGLQTVRAGKHHYAEKPLALTRADGRRLLAAAAKAGVRLGCAPDTVLGAGIQTARRVIDEGTIGRVVAGAAFMMCHGHESWHPDPEFYYAKGGGPLFDMGPYYVTALVVLLGPVRRVSGAAAITFPERTITSEPKRGQTIPVEVPTHVAGILEFHNGAIVTLVTSFDVWHHNMPCIELYGSEGSLQAPDPNGFWGGVRVRRHDEPDWHDAPELHPYGDGGRGLGVADLATAVRSGRAHRLTGEMAFHVLDVFQSLHESARTGRRLTLGSTCERPAAMRPDLPAGVLD